MKLRAIEGVSGLYEIIDNKGHTDAAQEKAINRGINRWQKIIKN